ncbi:MAG: hypothetical protein ACR2HN_04985 [Tepidiformaceae bacterium]
MNSLSSARWAAIAAIVFAIIFVAATVVLTGQIWYDITEDEYLDIYNDSTERAVIIATALVALLATAPLGIFLVHLLGRLRIAEGGEAPLTRMAQLAAAVIATTWVTANVAQANVAANITFGDYPTPSPELAQHFSGFGTGLVLLGTLFGASALMGLTATIAFRSGVFPRWLAWLSVVAAVLSLFGAAFYPALAFPVWLIAFGVHLLRRGEQPMMAAPPPGLST